MNDSFHYLSMANHMMVQKKLMEQLRIPALPWDSQRFWII